MKTMQTINIDNESIDLTIMGWAERAKSLCEVGRLTEAGLYEQYIWGAYRVLCFAIGTSHPSTVYAQRMFGVVRLLISKAMQNADSLHSAAESD